MPNILLISGSPASHSRTANLLEYAGRQLRRHGLTTVTTSVLDFPAEELLRARYDSPSFDNFKSQIAEAKAIIVATPVYKAAYTGSLKTLLDILPQGALRGKTILPLATGGTLAHLLAIDYALKPVLSVLGASDIQQGVYVVDAQFPKTEDGFVLDSELQQRFDESLELLTCTVQATTTPELAQA